MHCIDGNKIADKIIKQMEGEVKGKRLGVVLIGDNKESKLYVDLKSKKARQIGIDVIKFAPSPQSNPEKVKEAIAALAQSTDGTMIQLPLPEEMRDHTQDFIETIPDKKDVDGLKESSNFVSPVIQAIIAAIKDGSSIWNQDSSSMLSEKKVLIIMRSIEFTKSLMVQLKKEGIENVVYNNPENEGKEGVDTADIIISAVGKSGYITSEDIKEGAMCIDMGIEMVAGKARGDFHANCNQKAGAKTPVPGGIGPMTIAYLLKNLTNQSEADTHQE